MIEEVNEETGEMEMITKDFTEKRYIYPQVKWDRIELTDDRDQKQLVAQLYENGKIDSRTYFETFNLDYDEIQNRFKLERESGDIYMPDVIKDIAAGVGSELAPLVTQIIKKKMGLDKIKLEQPEEAPPEGEEPKKPEPKSKEERF